MTLQLNVLQRLNVWLLIGRLPFSGQETRRRWSLQDRIALDDSAKAEIEYREWTTPEGVGQIAWNAGKPGTVQNFEVTDFEIGTIRKSLDALPETAANVRLWLEPLWNQLDAKP